MALYLNKGNMKFMRYLNSKLYVDKSEMISVCNSLLNTENSYMCVTRPRRFGKTMTLSMLNAYYSKGCDSKDLFANFKIANDPSFLEHLNKHNVIWVDMASLFSDSGDAFLKELVKYVIKDLDESFPKVLTDDEDTIGKAIRVINDKLGERFIFLIDEWDVIFREEPGSKLCDEYIKLLRSLFKSSDVSECFDLVYMTGIMPIKRYSTESALNMFDEYNMLKPGQLAEYIGFTADEVKCLCDENDVDFAMMKSWYDGYKLDGYDIYNPCSVIKAIKTKKFDDYWNATGAFESITNYMNYDNGELKDKITLMLSGENVPVDVSLFDNDLTKVDSKDAALTVLIHLGYLAYDEENGTCYIPNYEISTRFETGLKKLDWHETSNPISNSLILYEETIKGNIDFINKTLDSNHKELASIFNKNKEDVLGIVVTISYYHLRDYYYVRKEDTCTTGRADITYTPKDGTHIPIVVELKADDSPDNALKQIKERNYSSVFKGYKGKALLLGISYDSKTLKHNSKIEYIEIR